MPKQLYIPLPCAEARRAMIERQLLGPNSSVQSALSNADLCKIVDKTVGYSGKHLPLHVSIRWKLRHGLRCMLNSLLSKSGN